MKDKKASVYIIKNHEVPRIKIGFAYNPDKRFSNIMNQSGCIMSLRYKTKPIINFAELESIMHIMYQDYRGIGEWFNISSEIVVNRLKDICINNENCKIIKHYEKGSTITEISNALNTPCDSVVRYLIYRGYKLTARDKKAILNKSTKKVRLTPEDISKMVLKNKEKTGSR